MQIIIEYSFEKELNGMQVDDLYPVQFKEGIQSLGIARRDGRTLVDVAFDESHYPASMMEVVHVFNQIGIRMEEIAIRHWSQQEIAEFESD